MDNQESLWEIAFEPNQGEKDNAGYWGTYNGPLVDAPGNYSGTSNYMGRANAFLLYCHIGNRFMNPIRMVA